jgi:hypothetical protein
MTHFNLVHVAGDGIHGTRAYQEVIDSVQWGLQQLGHDASCSMNSWQREATNIVFGGYLSPDLLVSGPNRTFYYNLDQICGHPQYDSSNPKDTVKLISSKFQIWDYSGANMATWDRLNPKYAVKIVPICYAPVLTRIENVNRRDIDILIYGAVGEQRLSVFASLGHPVDGGTSTVFASGLYGISRDSLIARSKIV